MATKEVQTPRKLTLKTMGVQPDFEAWYKGTPPKQTQVHRQNFVKFATGGKMFTARERVGQVVKNRLHSA